VHCDPGVAAGVVRKRGGVIVGGCLIGVKEARHHGEQNAAEDQGGGRAQSSLGVVHGDKMII